MIVLNYVIMILGRDTLPPPQPRRASQGHCRATPLVAMEEEGWWGLASGVGRWPLPRVGFSRISKWLMMQHKPSGVHQPFETPQEIAHRTLH